MGVTAGPAHGCNSNEQSVTRQELLPASAAPTRTVAACLVAIALVIATPACGTDGFSPHAATKDAALTVSDADNGRTVNLARGGRLRVLLKSTYWRIGASSDSSVLAAIGPAQIEADRTGRVPGTGSGTVSQYFSAISAGRAEVSADRVVCGEALACRPDQRHFAVTVIVGN
jgi:hypothetical protein